MTSQFFRSLRGRWLLVVLGLTALPGVAGLPASSAGLPASSACVSVALMLSFRANGLNDGA